MRDFRDILRTLREDRGLTKSELAERLGLSKMAISNYENGIRYPKPDVLEAIADFFNVDMNYLTGRETATSRFLSDEELRILNAYRSASNDTKNAVAAVLGVKRESAGGSSVASAI